MKSLSISHRATAPTEPITRALLGQAATLGPTNVKQIKSRLSYSFGYNFGIPHLTN